MPLLYERLRGYLLDEIQSGRLKPGDRVPSEAELAEQFNVSRITSKKALETLHHDGIVVRARGRGTFVADSIPIPALALEGRDPGGPSASGALARQIGLIVPNISIAFGKRMLEAIEERCALHGYHLIFRRTHGQRQTETEAITACVRAGITGLIVFPVHGEYYNDELLRIVLNGFPVVLVDRYLKGIAVSSICTDNYAASRAITAHLIEQGHTRLAFFSAPADRTSSIEDRRRGFHAAQRDHGLPVDPECCQMTLMSTLAGADFAASAPADAERIRAFLQARPDVTACLVCEHTLALLVEREVRALPWPNGAPVIACFDMPEDPFGDYPYAHIRQDETAMGYAAVDTLVAQIEHGTTVIKQVIDFELVPASR